MNIKKVWCKCIGALTLAFCVFSTIQNPCLAQADSLEYKEESLKNIKNVIIMIGDGMGPEHVRAGAIQKGEPLHIQTIEQTSYSLTASADNAVTDSAAGGTAIATGVRTNNGYVGKGTDGNDLTTIMDLALEQGKRTGVVTTDVLSGATPMDFAGHSKNRNASAELLETAADSGINLFIANQQDSIGTFTDKTGNVYTDVDDLDNISEAQSDYVIGDYSIKASAEPMSAESGGVAFDRVVRESLEYLSQEPDGFVLMAEGAKIDKKSHDNDFNGMLAEMLAFDDAVKVAMDWADERDDTVVIVTADHETGGLAIAENATKETLNESYSWSTDWHTATNVYCKVYGVDVDFARYSSLGSADSMKNTDIFEMSKAFLYGRQEVEVKTAKKTIPYGKVSFDKEQYFFGEKVIITTKPNDNYELTSLKVNNEEMISSVVDNVLEYTIDEKIVSVDAKFTKIPVVTFDITYDDLGDKGSYELKQTSIKAGEKLTVKINPAEGYVIDKVTFNGEEMAKLSANMYEIVVQASGVVSVTFIEVETENSAGTATSSNVSGCSGSLGVGISGFIVLAGLSIALMKRKSEK